MRLLMNVTMPHEPFNAAVRDGSIGGKLEGILKRRSPRRSISRNGTGTGRQP